MDIQNIFDCRRSIRSFTGEPITEAQRKKLLHAANASPVGRGKYDSVHLTVITDKEMLAQVEKSAASLFKVERAFLYGAPELILVSTAAADNVGYSNAAIIAHDMALAAVDEGVGVCHIWGCIIALASNPELCRKLGIPEGFTPACAVAVGQTAETYTERTIPEDRIQINYI